jgi:uncharacterized protein
MSSNDVTALLKHPTLQNIVAAQPYPLLFANLSGAHLYGFPSPDSDYDLRAIHILPMDRVLGLHGQANTIDSHSVIDGMEVDWVSYEIKEFFQLILKKSGNIVENIMSPLVLHSTPEHEELRAILPQTLSPHHAHHYYGFSRRKWADFAEQGRKAKDLLYTYRTLLTGIHLMKTGEVQSNVLDLNAVYRLPYIDDLIAAKLAGGERGVLPAADLAFHEAEFQRLTEDLRQAQANSHLPQQPDGFDALNDLLVRVRHRYDR